LTLGLVKYCALPTYSGLENANLHPDSPNPASQIPRLIIAYPRSPFSSSTDRQTRETRFQRRRSLRHNTKDPPIIILHKATKARSKQRPPSGSVWPFGRRLPPCFNRNMVALPQSNRVSVGGTTCFSVCGPRDSVCGPTEVRRVPVPDD